MSDLVTVVIPNYNGMKYVADCLDSILAGTLIPKIVVVDNASKDGSRELIEERYPNVTLLKLGVNTGFCHAVNAGLHITRTPYAMLLNNDTRVEPDCLEKLLAAMEKSRRIFSMQALMVSMQDPDVIDDAGDLYSALGWAFERGKGNRRASVQKGWTQEAGGPRSAQESHPAPGRTASAGRPVRIFSACAGAALYRMSVFDEIGWFDERHFCYLEDVDIGWRAQIAGYGNRVLPDAVVCHAGSATSGSRHNAFKERLVPGNNAYLQYKNMPFLQYALNAPLRALGRVVKKRYFDGMGLGEAYQEGLDRGAYLIAGAKEAREFSRAGVPWKKGSLSDEACVEGAPKAGADLTLDEVVPIYLGGKVPFRISALPRYISIEGQLLSGCVRRLCRK